MKTFYLVCLTLVAVVLSACEDNTESDYGTSINSILGSNSRSLFKVQVGDQYGYIKKNGDQAFDSLFSEADDFYNDLAGIGERTETTERTDYENKETQSISFTSSSSIYINGEYTQYYGKYGETRYGNTLPSNCKYYDYYSGTELSGYQNGDLITSKYRVEWYYYGVFQSYNTSYYTTDDVVITSNSPYIYDTYYIIVPYYTKRLNSNVKYGFINSKGQITIPAIYTSVDFFTSDGIALVNEGSEDSYYDGEYSFINKKGEKISNDTYYRAEFFTEGLASVKYTEDSKYQFIDTEGLPVITNGYDDAYPFINGLAAVKNNDYWGFINKEGVEVTPLRFKRTTGLFTHNLIGVSDKSYDDDESSNSWYFVNKEGKEAFGTNTRYDDVEPFFEGLAAVEIGERWRYINTNGEYAFNTSFSRTDGFSDGLAAVQDNNELWGYINQKGEFSIITQYLEADEFVNGIAKVVFTDRTWGYIDKTGSEIWRSTETTDIYYSTRNSTKIEGDKTIKYVKKAVRLYDNQ